MRTEQPVMLINDVRYVEKNGDSSIEQSNGKGR